MDEMIAFCTKIAQQCRLNIDSRFCAPSDFNHIFTRSYTFLIPSFSLTGAPMYLSTSPFQSGGGGVYTSFTGVDISGRKEYTHRQGRCDMSVRQGYFSFQFFDYFDSSEEEMVTTQVRLGLAKGHQSE